MTSKSVGQVAGKLLFLEIIKLANMRNYIIDSCFADSCSIQTLHTTLYKKQLTKQNNNTVTRIKMTAKFREMHRTHKYLFHIFAFHSTRHIKYISNMRRFLHWDKTRMGSTASFLHVFCIQSFCLIKNNIYNCSRNDNISRKTTVKIMQHK